MMIYCIDTSSLIDAWQARYPIEHFPNVWARIDGLAAASRLLWWSSGLIATACMRTSRF